MPTSITPKAIVVHAGARDSYQVSQALLDLGLLDKLVTNVYWPSWAKRHYGAEIPFSRIRVGAWGLMSYCLKRLKASPRLERSSDRSLGRLSARLAKGKRSAILAYSYYASTAFHGGGERNKRILFQLHPHPLSVRQLLLEELDMVPAARDSLCNELELALPFSELEELAGEPQRADAIIAASSFTMRTLVENDCGSKPIRVVPYGVDRTRFPPRKEFGAAAGPLRVMWLGQICQRKGLSYLLDAVRMVSSRQIKVLLRGFGSVDWNLLNCYRDLAIDVQQGAPRERILQELHHSDIFALPSLVEGFGHSILEAMSSGLPVITTPHTCGADVVESGVNGFIVPIRSSESIGHLLDWALVNRSQLIDIGRAATVTASRFTWPAFRAGIQQAYISFVGGGEGSSSNGRRGAAAPNA